MGRIGNSIIWSTVEKFSVQGIQLVLSLIIARILSPSDYGLVAMVSVFLNVSQIFIDSGFSKALIQKQNRTNADLSTVFFFNIGISASIYLLLFIFSPYIARFYSEPKLSLIVRITALNIIITSFSAIQYTLININLSFKKYARITLISILISSTCGLFMAYRGCGVWTLITQALLNNLLICSFLWLSSSWRPLPLFSTNSFKELFSFGSKILLSSFITSIYGNLYTLFIGKLFTAKELGIYNRSVTIVTMPSSNITEIITRVTYPVECELQNNNALLSEKFFCFIQLTCYLVFPLMIGLLVLAKPLVVLILSEKWIECVPIIQILCLAYILQPIMSMNWQLLNVKHRSDYSLKSEIIKKIVAIIILIITSQMGVIEMCWGLVLYSLIDMVIITYYTKKVLADITFIKEAKLLIPIFLLSAAMGISIYSIKSMLGENYMLQIISGVTIGIVFYVTMSYIFKFKELKILYSFIHK